MKVKAKQQLLESISPIADLFIGVALGDKRFVGGDAQEKAAHKVWDSIAPMLKSAADHAEMPSLSDGSISARVEAVMQGVASGQIDIDQGKRLIEMLQAGFEITELKDLIGKLAEAGVELE